MVARYSNSARLRRPFDVGTALLRSARALAIGFSIVAVSKRRTASPALPLTDEKCRRLGALLHSSAEHHNVAGTSASATRDMSAAAAVWNVPLTINFDSILAAVTAKALSESVGRVDARAAAHFKRTLASAPADAPGRSMVIKRLAEAKTGSDAFSSSSGAGN
jgi:hypothetical protein